jgi:hypothetical protein
MHRSGVQLGRHRRQRRHPAQGDDRGDLTRRDSDQVTVRAQDRGRVIQRPQHRPGQHPRTHRVESERETHDGAEGAAAASQAPEQVWMLVVAGRHDRAVGGHDLGGVQVVDGQAVPAASASRCRRPAPGRRRRCG